MSLKLYDEAVIEKIKKWTNNTQVHVYNSGDIRRIFETVADERNDRPMELPMILIRRNGGYKVLNPNKQPLSYDAKTLEASYEKSVQLNAIPIQIDYQLDIFTRYLEEADEYTRNIVFNIVNFPTINVKLPYNGAEVIHSSTISMSNDVDDTSDIPERFVSGQFTRFTINISIENAYLWDIRVRDNVHIADTLIHVSEQEPIKVPSIYPDSYFESNIEDKYIDK